MRELKTQERWGRGGKKTQNPGGKGAVPVGCQSYWTPERENKSIKSYQKKRKRGIRKKGGKPRVKLKGFLKQENDGTVNGARRKKKGVLNKAYLCADC